MNATFEGWDSVAGRLRAAATKQQKLGVDATLNAGQRASLIAVAERIGNNGIMIADEVGMGKTRIAVAVARAVTEANGRVAILVPPGLGFQWHAELSDGGVEAPPILRSLKAYLRAWKDPEPRPWFANQVVLTSHAFVRWKISERSERWRWALLPEIYAHWRKRETGSNPRRYYDGVDPNGELGLLAMRAAASICDSASKSAGNPVAKRLQRIYQETQWIPSLDATNYARDGELRVGLERAVGLGLGAFDLVIIDEAHKSRGKDSGLNRLLETVLVHSPNARRLSMTATPVELDPHQWEQSLDRLQISKKKLGPITSTIENYAEAVRRLRGSWRSSSDARDNFRDAAQQFQSALSDYVIRRDKREEPSVQEFQRAVQVTGYEYVSYRQETEIPIEIANLQSPWRKAVCAAEALSIATKLTREGATALDQQSKRMRLTLGNGHGIAAWLDEAAASPDESLAVDSASASPDTHESEGNLAKVKRAERIAWWSSVISSAMRSSPAQVISANALYDHPAIMAATREIEAYTADGEKVLVFGRFTRPMRALVELLNAREMLRRLEAGEPWPSSTFDLPPVQAAHRQLGSTVKLKQLAAQLESNYDKEQRRRAKVRLARIETIREGMTPHTGTRYHELFAKFARHATEDTASVVAVQRALEAFHDDGDENEPDGWAQAFCKLIDAVGDQDSSDQIEKIEDVSETWHVISKRIADDPVFRGQQGGFARFMYGSTTQDARRTMQRGFNRPDGHPRVLVAQSVVGREGLNLHEACRAVVLLHPEWNPGVVEQQVGRVDRVGSQWEKELSKVLKATTTPDATTLPRIEIRPVVFRGTYDEYNWTVLRARQADLRAQLFGIVIPGSEAEQNPELAKELNEAAPSFSPSRGAK